MTEPLATLKSLCQTLKLPAVAREAVPLAEAARAARGRSVLGYLCQVLDLEVSERAARRAARRIPVVSDKEAGFPQPKTLESFDLRRAPALPEVQLRRLAAGDYIDRAETVILMGEPGTGKTH